MPAKCLSLFLIGFSCLLAGCLEKSVERDFPLVVTNGVSNISENGATFNGEVGTVGQWSITSFGFVWSRMPNPKLGSGEEVHIGSSPTSGKFQFEVKTNLEVGLSYFVRAFAVANSITFYGNEIQFESLGSQAPEIKSIVPGNGDIGDTIKIIGSYFSIKNANNKVQFGATSAVVVSSSFDELKVIVPTILTAVQVPVSVSIVGNVGQSPVDFQLNPPSISSIKPGKIHPLGIITVYGKNFIPGHTLAGKQGFQPTPLTECNFCVFNVTSDSIRFSFRETEAGQYKIEVKVLGVSAVSATTIQNVIPEIFELIPPSGNIGDTIIIRGEFLKGFNTQVKFGTSSAKIVSAFDTLISVVVPNITESPSSVKITYNKDNIFHSLEAPTPFETLPAEITSLSSSTGIMGNILTIFGRNFNNITKVSIGETQAAIKSKSIDSVAVAIPVETGGPKTITITSMGVQTTGDVPFTIVPPEIAGLLFNNLYVGAIATLDGNFSIDPKILKIFVDDIPASKISIENQNRVRFQIGIPDFNKTVHTIKVATGELFTEADILNISEPSLISYSPGEIGFKDEITLVGVFPDIPGNTTFEGEVYIGTSKAKFIKKEFIVPNEYVTVRLDEVLSQGLHEVRFHIGGKSYFFSEMIKVPWRKMNYSVSAYFAFAILNSVYIGNSSGFFELNHNTGSLSALSTLPGDAGAFFATTAFKPFVINGKAYVGFINNEIDVNGFWEYDPNLDQWTQKASLPIEFQRGFSFPLNDEGFVGAGLEPTFSGGISGTYHNNLWEYDIVTDLWTEVASFPGTLRRDANAVSLNNNGYIVGGVSSSSVVLKDSWKYDPLTDQWTPQANPPIPVVSGPSFVDNGQILIGTGDANTAMWKFDPVSESWRSFARPGEVTTSFPARAWFQVNGKTYVIYNNGAVWEYDPNL